LEKPAEIVTVEENEFVKKLDDDAKIFTLPEAYKGFYNARQVAIMTENDIFNAGSRMNFDDLINSETALLPKRIEAAASDIEILKAIASRTIQTKSFDFDGIKYKQDEAVSVAEKMESEQKELVQQLEALDKQIIHFFYTKTKESGREKPLQSMYKKYFDDRNKADEYLKHMNAMLDNMQPIYTGQMIPIEQINAMIETHKNKHEPEFKKWLKDWAALNAFVLSSEVAEKANKFCESDYKYFDGTSFFDAELAELHQLCNESWLAVNNFLFLQFKSILELQLEVLNN